MCKSRVADPIKRITHSFLAKQSPLLTPAGPTSFPGSKELGQQEGDARNRSKLLSQGRRPALALRASRDIGWVALVNKHIHTNTHLTRVLPSSPGAVEQTISPCMACRSGRLLPDPAAPNGLPPAPQGKQRELYLREMAKLDELNNQVEAIKATLSKTANELGTSTAENEGVEAAVCACVCVRVCMRMCAYVCVRARLL